MPFKKSIYQKIIEKKFLIFDFDGTLVNTLPLHEKAFKATLKDIDSDFNYHEYQGLKTQEVIKMILKKKNIPENKHQKLASKLTLQKQKLANELLNNCLEIENALLKFLDDMHQREIIMAIVSSGARRNIFDVLKKFQLNHYFSLVLCAEDIKYPKPNPDGFLMAKKVLKFSNKEAIIFEDSDPGIQAAIAAKIDYIKVADNFWESLI